MSGDHNQYQKDKSYLDGMDRYKQVRELVKDPSLRIKDIAELTGYNKGHVSRLRKASQQFKCPRCGHCCQALEEKQDPLYWSVADGWVYADDTSQNEEGRYGAIESKANARLIAAAPDLLEALKEAASALEWRWERVANRAAPVHETAIQEAYNQARAAIAKATGEKS